MKIVSQKSNLINEFVIQTKGALERKSEREVSPIHSHSSNLCLSSLPHREREKEEKEASLPVKWKCPTKL
jgi:hypothetical protein